jgi:endonuclease YncB( thermonuclease family)
MGLCYSCYLNQKLKTLDNQVPLFDLKGKEYMAKVVDVYDGDTCSIVIFLNKNFTKFKLRCLGYDTPEMKPSKNLDNREELINMAIKSRNYFISRVTNCNVNIDKHYTKCELKELLSQNTKLIKVKSHGWDKYGRFLGEIYIDNKNFNQEMIDKNYGYEYDGGTKKQFSINI